MRDLKFYHEKPSLVKEALFYSYGNMVWVAPGLLTLGLFDNLVVTLASYGLLGGLMVHEKSRSELMKFDSAFREVLRKFKDSKEVSEILRLTLERRKLVYEKESKKESKEGILIEQLVEYPEIDIKKDGYNYYFDFHMLPGQVELDWEKSLNAFAHAFRSQIVRAEVDRGVVTLILNHTKVNAKEVAYKFDDEHNLCVGYSVGGKLMWNFDEFPHGLIIGETGSGKSTFMRHLLVQFRPDWIIKIIDGKLVEFDFMRDLGFDVAEESESVFYIERTAEELQKRLRVMKEQKVNHYTKLEGMKPYFLIIDELAVIANRLSGKKKKGEEESERDRVFKMLEDIGSRGRAAGVFLIIIVQRPDASYMPTFVRDNIQMKISLGKSSKTAYEMAFGEDGKQLKSVDKGMGYGIVEREIEMFSFPNYPQEKFVEDLKWIHSKKSARKLRIVSDDMEQEAM